MVSFLKKFINVSESIESDVYIESFKPIVNIMLSSFVTFNNDSWGIIVFVTLTLDVEFELYGLVIGK